MDKQRSGAIAAAIVGNSIFGFSFMASKIALRYTTPALLLTLRFGMSLLILSALAAAGVGRLRLKGRSIVPLLLIGFCQPVIYFLCETYGIQFSTTSFSGVMIGLVPVASLILSVLILKEPFSAKKLLWVLLSVLGVALISLSERSEGTISVMGVVFLLGAVLAAACYNILTRRYGGEFSVFERTYMMFAMGFVTFLCISLAESRGQILSAVTPLFHHGDFWLAVLYLAVFSSVLAFFCVNYAVGLLRVQQSSAFANLASVISVAAGVLLMHEPFTPLHLVGIVLVVVSIYRINTLP